MRLETWEDNPEVGYDWMPLSDLTTLAFSEARHAVLILGPMGVANTHLATAVGHIVFASVNRVVCSRADRLFTRLRAARLDNSLAAELRRIAVVDVLIIR